MGTLAAGFHALFRGSETAYGTYNDISEERGDGKKLGKKISTVRGEVTEAMWQAHLDGKSGLGVIPIMNDSTVWFGAVDIDVYDGLDHKALSHQAAFLKLPLVVCRSKSGGAHLFCFAKEPVSAGKMKARLLDIASLMGHGNSEIFPKQVQILADRGDIGQWINMPYFNGMRGMRVGIRPDGNAMSPEEFLANAAALRVEPAWFSEPITKPDDLSDGPPCLQHLIVLGFPEGTRNNGLFNIGVYLRKAFPDSWRSKVEEYNRKYMNPPLSAEEIVGIAKSLGRKDYCYKCSEQPIAPHCNASLCRTRKHGVSGGASSNFPTVGGLTKLDSRPPLWFWDVDGARIELTTQELQDPKAFQRKCVDHLNVMPPIPGRAVWESIVNAALSNVMIVEAPSDASPEGQFWILLQKFCTSKSQALTIDEVALGKPFHDGPHVYFRIVDVMSFLERNHFRDFKLNKVCSLLRDNGGKSIFMHLKTMQGNVWQFPGPKVSEEKLEQPAQLNEEPPF